MHEIACHYGVECRHLWEMIRQRFVHAKWHNILLSSNVFHCKKGANIMTIINHNDYQQPSSKQVTGSYLGLANMYEM